MTFIKLFLTTLPILAVIDLIWITVVASSFYKNQLGTLLAPFPNYLAAGAFYLLYVAGLVFFVLMPGLASRSLAGVVFAGAFFGLVAYATYDLTNLATTRDWPLVMSLVDMAWGTFAGGVISGAVYLVATKLFGL